MKRLLCGMFAAAFALTCSACSFKLNVGSSQTETTATQQSSATEAVKQTETSPTSPTGVAAVKAADYVKVVRTESWTSNGTEFECVQPEIGLDSADAKAANAEIAKICGRIFDAYDKGEEMPYLSKGTWYEAYLNSKTLSVVFADRAANNNVIDYYVYNFDIDSGAKISDDELLARAGSDRETAKSKLTDRVNAFFDEKIAESSAAPSDVFEEARSYSVSDENLSQAKYYLADNNILMAVYRYRWVAGAAYYYNQTGVYPSLPQF